ncbi:MAG TPA: DUF3017 domain-containing protein [Streptosporangiaceae bacterium]|nr:DUF3017 domain-containing protein [Streptosporangiaceae bacterium]
MRHAARGTAKPLAGGRKDAGRRRTGRRRLQQLPYWVVLAGTAAALVTIRGGTHHVKSGTLVLAGVLLIAAVARLVLPDKRLGMLSSRRRLLDVAILAALGIGLLVAGLGVPAPG